MIKLIHIRNPLQPSSGRETHELGYVQSLGLEHYLAKAGVSDAEGIVVSVNGVVLPPEKYGALVLRDQDCIVVAPRVAGGSLFQTLGRVALLATSIALIATGVGAALGAALGVAATTGNAILAGAIGIAGNLLIAGISSLLTPAQKAQTPSYAFDGPHSLAQSGTVIPKGYGKFQSGGNIIGSFVDVEGKDQYINVLVSFGFGPARSLTSLQINGKAIGNYSNVQYYTRLGSNNQQPIANFNRIVNGYPQDTQCLAGIPVVVPGTGDQTQILQVDVSFPSGVYYHTNDGNIIGAVITYTVEYSVSGAADWKPVLQPLTTSDVVSYDYTTGLPLIPHAWCVVATDMPPNSGVCYALDDGPHSPGDPWSGSMTVETFQPNGNHSTYTKTFYGEWQLTNPLINQVLVLTWTDGYQDFVGASTQALYNRTTIYGLTAGKYDVRITKYGSAKIHDDVQPGDNFAPNIGQDMWVHSVNEVALLDLAYPNMILVGVRALATSQISGSGLNVTALVEYGLRTLDNNILPGALQAFEEDNPACVAADMMLDGLYGGGQYPGITATNIIRYIDEWVAWAQLNDELVDDGNGNSIRRHIFNGIFDNESNLWEQLNVVGQMSRAAIIPLGRDYGVYVDQPDTPVQIFTMGNIGADSFTETWIDIDSRANQVEVQFADATRYWKQDNPLVYMDPANQDAGVAIKNVRVNGKGITSPAQAWHFARFRERCNQFLLRTGSFNCDVEAIACRPGNVIILQHDVPQWGWGGRSLPGSTASAVILDRNDVAFVTGTNYSLILLHPALQRYSGTVSAVAAVTDATGAVLGTSLTLSSFDNASRVTRAILFAGSAAGVDCVISSSAAGSVVLQPPPGFSPAAGQTYQLWDTDVLETRAVSSVAQAAGAQVVSLATPLSQVPQDFSTYFYGPTGSQKLARVTMIRKASEFRAKIEWIDYSDQVYVDAVPTIGETSAVVTSNPGVTSLTGTEVFTLVSGSYVPSINLSWQLGPDTVGAAIYQQIVTSGMSISNALPEMIARLTGYSTGYSLQAVVGQETVFTVVGFDSNDNYAALASAPTVTITAVGVADNLLLGSSFASGFAYWNIQPRAGDSLVPTFSDDGEAEYTIAGTTLTTAQPLLYQVVPPAQWAVGDYLLLSAYFLDSCVSSSAPNVGQLVATITFRNSSNTEISHVDATAALNGVTPTLTRAVGASTQIPANTVAVVVSVGVEGTGLSIPVGSVLTMSHLLLEISTAGQTVPSAWADIDASGHILDLFTSGSSTGLRVQGSTVPSFTGDFSFTFTDTTASIPWSNLVIKWPDGAFTFIQDSSLALTGLTAATKYYAYPYFDVLYGGVKFATPSSAVGTPALLSTAYDADADAACRQDGRVPLAAGGLTFTTAASGGSGGGTGGGGTGTGGSGGGPIGDPGRPIDME